MHWRQVEKAVLVVLAFPMYVASILWPKRSDLWLFGAWFGKSYSDNSRYVFEQASKIHAVNSWWIAKEHAVVKEVRNAGFKAQHAYSPLGIWLQLRAKVFICTVNSFDFCPPLITRKNIFVQLWHGTPLKAILLQTIDRHGFKYWTFRFRSWLIDNYDIVVSPGSYTDKVFSEAFGVPSSRMLRAGYPRCDAMHITNEEVRSIKEALNAEGKSLWFYLPTHRQQGQCRESPNVAEVKKLIALSNEFEERNIVLVVKPHFYELDHFRDVAGTANVQLRLSLPKELYRCLGAADGIITDYSSVAFDFAILNRPIVFFAYDEHSYREGDRQLNLSLTDISGLIARRVEDLPYAIDKSLLKKGTGLIENIGVTDCGLQAPLIVTAIREKILLRHACSV